MAVKNINLRAFRIANDDISKSSSGIKKMLLKKLAGKPTDVKRMKLNNEDSEEDLIAYFEDHSSHFYGIMLRMCPSGDLKSIPNSFLQKEKFLITELDDVIIEKNNIRKNHYYFSLNDKFLVTNLSKNITISCLQTYINWILKEERGDRLFEFTPMITELADELKDTKLSDLKSITVKDKSVHKGTALQNKNSVGKKSFNIATSLIDALVDDSITLEKIKESKIISAELLIKFSRPKEMSKEDYEKTMGAFLKPVSDPEDFVFTTKNGNKTFYRLWTQ
jgi:hypothetical protein